MSNTEAEDTDRGPDEPDDEALADEGAEDAPPEPVEPDVSAGMSEAEIERAMKALDKEATRHANRVSEIMGEDAQQLSPCPLCVPSMAGFIFPDAIPEDQREAVLMLFLGVPASEYETDPLAEECETCKGEGFTTTGSKVPQYQQRPCPACIGMGFMDHTRRAQWDGEQALRNPPAPPAPLVPAYVAPSNGTPDVDAWGRPRGHWLYGRDPRYLTEGERASDLPHVQAV